MGIRKTIYWLIKVVSGGRLVDLATTTDPDQAVDVTNHLRDSGFVAVMVQQISTD